MSKLNVLLLAAGLTGVVAVSAACNGAPKWDAVCEHLGEIMEIEVTEEMCTEMESEVSGECGDNTNAAMRCVMGADDMAAFEECQEICEDEEEEESE